MKKALISPNENYRVAQVATEVFEVSTPLFWIDCPDDTTEEWHLIDGVFTPPAPPAVVLPQAVTMRQARLALLKANLLPSVSSAVSQGSEADQITWEYATEVSRSDALVSNLRVSLGLTETQLDNLFLLAGTL